MSQRLNLGFEIVVHSEKGYSFRILRNRAGGNNPEVIRGMDCPLWFTSRAAAISCVRDLGRFVMEQMRRDGFKVEKFEN